MSLIKEKQNHLACPSENDSEIKTMFVFADRL